MVLGAMSSCGCVCLWPNEQSWRSNLLIGSIKIAHAAVTEHCLREGEKEERREGEKQGRREGEKEGKGSVVPTVLMFLTDIFRVVFAQDTAVDVRLRQGRGQAISRLPAS